MADPAPVRGSLDGRTGWKVGATFIPDAEIRSPTTGQTSPTTPAADPQPAAPSITSPSTGRTFSTDPNAAAPAPAAAEPTGLRRALGMMTGHDPIEAAKSALAGGGRTFVNSLQDQYLLGLPPKLEAALASGLGPDTFGQSLENIRNLRAQDVEQHPIAATAGQGIGLGLQAATPIPGLGTMGAGKMGAEALAPAIRNMIASGGTGAMTAMAESDATTVGGQLEAGARGAAGGLGAQAGFTALGQAARYLVKSAPARTVGNILQDVTSGSGIRTAKGKALKVADVLGSPEEADKMLGILQRSKPTAAAVQRYAGTNPARALEAVEARTGELYRKADAIYNQVDAKVGGMPVGDLLAAVRAAQARFRKTPGTVQLGDALEQQVDQLKRAWVDPALKQAEAAGLAGSAAMSRATATKVPMREARQFITDVGRGAFQSTDELKDLAKKHQAARGVYRDLVTALEKRAERAGVDVSTLRELNRESSTWIPIGRALDERAKKESIGMIGMITRLTGPAALLGGAVTSGAGASGTGAMIAAAPYTKRYIADPAQRAIDMQLANIAIAAKHGAKRQVLERMATDMQLPPAMAAQVGAWAASQAPGAPSTQPPASLLDITDPDRPTQPGLLD